MIFTTVATAVLGVSITLNIYFLGSLGLTSSATHTQTVVVDGNKSETVAVIPVTGVILGGTAERFDTMMSAAEKDSNVKAVVIEVDTPGGAVAPSDEIYARIVRFRQKNPKRPVVVTMGGMATSGGYYVACAADYIYAEPMTWTANIGVILPRYNVSKLAKSYGVEEVTLTAPSKGYKHAGSPFAPVDEKDNAYYQELIDGAYARFKDVVVKGRGSKLTANIADIANGKAYGVADAMRLGLVDNEGYASDAYDKAAAMASLSNKRVVKYSKPRGLFDLSDLVGGANGSADATITPAAGGGGGATMTINGVNVNVDASLLDELTRPRLMFR